MSAFTRGLPNTITGTVGTSVITVLAGLKAVNFLCIHNPNSTGLLAATYDGVTIPVVNGAGITIAAEWEDYYDNYVPIGAVQIIGSTSGMNYTVMWM
jgi:hypothetical protein